MATEILRGNSFVEVSDVYGNATLASPGNAYDASNTTYSTFNALDESNQGFQAEADYSGFGTPAHTWTAATLYIKHNLFVGVNGSPAVECNVSTDGGSTWEHLLDGAPPSTGIVTRSLSVTGVTPSQVRVQYILSADPSANANAYARVYDIWIEGTYTDVPTITNVTPTNPLYGEAIVVTGTGFTGATTVKIGTTSVGFAVNSATQITINSVGQGVTGVVSVTTASGTGSGSQTVTVQTVSIAAGGNFYDTYVTMGLTATMSASVSGATSTNVFWSAASGSFSVNPTASGSNTVWTPSTTGAITITAQAGVDGSKTVSKTYTVVAAPTISSFNASTTSPLYGAAVTLTPTFANGTGVIDQGVGNVTSGSGYSTGSMTTPKTYTLTVTNQAASFAQASVTVTPQTVSVSAISPGTPTKSVNSVTTFSASVSGAADSSIVWSASAGSMNPSTGQWTAPATPQSVTITATSAADGTKYSTTTVTVVALPVATSLVGSPNPFLQGNTVTLTPTFSSSTSARIGTTPGGTEVTASAVTGTGYSVTPVDTITYYLRVYNAAGDYADASVIVREMNYFAATPQQIQVATGALQLVKQVAASVGMLQAASASLTSQIRMASGLTQTQSVQGFLTTGIRLVATPGQVQTATGALTTAIRMAGSAQMVASASLENTTYMRAYQVQGSTATLSTAIRMAGPAAQVQTVTATLTASIRMAGALGQVQAVTGNITTNIRLQAAPTMVQAATGALTAQIRLLSQLWQTQTVSGTLFVTRPVQASVGMTQAATGSLNTSIRLAGTAAMVQAVSAPPLGVYKWLQGSAVGNSSATGALTVLKRLAGAIKLVQSGRLNNTIRNRRPEVHPALAEMFQKLSR